MEAVIFIFALIGVWNVGYKLGQYLSNKMFK